MWESRLTVIIVLSSTVIVYVKTENGSTDEVTESNNSNKILSLYEYTQFLMKKQWGKSGGSQQTSQMLPLLQYITHTYMTECNLLFMTHTSFPFETKKVNFDITKLLRDFVFPVAHTKITKNNVIAKNLLLLPGSYCMGYILFVQDITLTDKIIGSQSLSKVVVVTGSSYWKIREYLEGSKAKSIVNILVIATSGPSDVVIRRGEKIRGDNFINMYTHEIYTDGVGSSKLRLLTSWRGAQLARDVTLFPKKLLKGFHGRQFEVVASSQPPYVIKKRMDLADDADESVLWDGIEIRLLQMIGAYLNFTMLIKEAPPTTNTSGGAEVVSAVVAQGLADLASAGAYRPEITSDDLAYSLPHSVDCAVFVTRSSTALPRYRAILGPFHWHVWLALIITYLIAIFPLTFADQHSFQVLVDNPWHAETMFWYVFGTFTNCFTFKGARSWTNSNRHASRMFVGWYWAFSIIITACYTGSIIAFITLYVYPAGIDTVDQLVADNYRVATLGTGGWGTIFNNSAHPKTKWLLRDIDLVPSIYEGLKNVSDSFYLPLFRPYAFLASRAVLEYNLRTNFTLKNRKDVMYIAKECFAPIGISIIYPAKAPYIHKINEYVLRAQQSGLIYKMYREMDWELLRSSTGQRLQAGSGKSLRVATTQDRTLTLDDTQGIFILLGFGYLIAITALLSEKLRHHRTAGGSFKLWQWSPKGSFVRISLRLQETIKKLTNERRASTTLSMDNDFIYKTYDSRILASQLQNMQPMKFASEFIFRTHERYGTISKAKSLPTMSIVTAHLRKSSSCHDINSHSLAPDNCCFVDSCPDVAPSMRFGSVGSILEIKQCPGVLQYKFNLDRPQTCQI